METIGNILYEAVHPKKYGCVRSRKERFREQMSIQYKTEESLFFLGSSHFVSVC